VDDAIVEGIAVGATGWIAGLANALPRESAELFQLCDQRTGGASLAALSLVPAVAAFGYAAGQELKETQRLIDNALRHRPQAVASQAMAMVK
jgi:hypothetical protein